MDRLHNNLINLVTLSWSKGLGRFRSGMTEILHLVQNDSQRLVVLGVLVFAGCSKAPVAPIKTRPAIRVQTLEAQLTRAPNIVEVAGTVQARRTATIAAKITATIRAVAVQPGALVTAGQVLAQLDDRTWRAEYNRAKADYDRYHALQEKAAATPADVEAVLMRYRVAEAALSDCQLVAPFAGQVTTKSCDVGDLATPGQRLFTLAQATDFRLEVNVPERAAASVVLGQSISCVIEATSEKCAGQVDEVLPVADPATRTVLAKISLRCQKTLQSGMFGHAQLVLGERTALFVPQAAVHERGQLTYVFIAAAGKAQMRLVKPGASQLESVEILAGVQPGERLIISSEKEISDGQPISF